MSRLFILQTVFNIEFSDLIVDHDWIYEARAMESRLLGKFPAGKGLTSWLLLVMFIVFLLLSHVVYWVRCGT